jgi:acetylornithine deacetylase
MELTIDRGYLVRALSELVHINSVNPALVPGAPGEAEIAAFVAESLREIGMQVDTYEPEAGRASVVGQLRGRGTGRSLMLNAHTDTVGVDGMPDPFSAEIRNGRMYGRGAYDMKGSLASCMAACKALLDAGVSLGGDLLVAAVADEEHASLGTADLIERYRVDGAVVTEPSEMEVCIVHKGFVWLSVETTGRAAHGSRFEEGVDANMMMGRFLAELDVHERELRSREGHPLVGPPSLHAATIEGGTGLSTYAARCRLQVERRTVPGETGDQAVAEIRAIIEGLTAADPTFRATVEPFFVRDPFVVSSDAHIVRTVRKAAARVLGRELQFIGQTGWTDAGLISVAGVETVVMGPCGAGAHAVEEWVDLESLIDLAYVLAHTAADYCS